MVRAMILITFRYFPVFCCLILQTKRRSAEPISAHNTKQVERMSSCICNNVECLVGCCARVPFTEGNLDRLTIHSLTPTTLRGPHNEMYLNNSLGQQWPQFLLEQVAAQLRSLRILCWLSQQFLEPQLGGKSTLRPRTFRALFAL